jgi:tRNA (cmo5U34)-methyltransferase
MSYFDYGFPRGAFDAAVSVMSLHHFSHEMKTGLYKKLLGTLKKGGIYVECDYMVTEQKLEDEFFEARRTAMAEMGDPPGFFHIDTPCTIENQIAMLKTAGFKNVKQVWKKDNAVILTADK